jgi:hypothetical protein
LALYGARRAVCFDRAARAGIAPSGAAARTALEMTAGPPPIAARASNECDGASFNRSVPIIGPRSAMLPNMRACSFSRCEPAHTKVAEGQFSSRAELEGPRDLSNFGSVFSRPAARHRTSHAPNGTALIADFSALSRRRDFRGCDASLTVARGSIAADRQRPSPHRGVRPHQPCDQLRCVSASGQ